MEIRRLFYSLIRKWWLIVLLAVLGGGISYLSEHYTEPVYQAETKLYISNRAEANGKALNSSEIALRQELVRQYYDIIYSRSMTSAVSQAVKEYNLSENEILSMVNIASKEDTNIFTISARGPDPTIVAAVANATGREFITQLNQLSNSDNVGILDAALVPSNPVNSMGRQKVLLGILLGLTVALGIIYSIEYYDTTVRSAEDIVKGLNLRVIGIIPEHDIR
ncbi:YveK family protein [Desulfosporosinus youngiae]|uniref:Capsular polysaccharide biosynthesis protein n=1 Tax=Desulfosporosinus youngiae DSM 17734 TaxID=768710 RepID=H5XUE3_9FIRM|nr:Wzz/FepE/Etk N-terminal domain-containing protein [Desulfosporosinus youngiae]EHQ89379.1 capsular polysaccharide biosynthesis protein [Desulfosporosinus youngiae DSM 17734]